MLIVKCVDWRGQDERRLAYEPDDRHPYLIYRVKQTIDVCGSTSNNIIIQDSSTYI